jgi:hypothetical protein
MSDQADYHRARAAQELAQAANTSDKSAAKLHNELAKFHKAAVLKLERTTLNIVTDR